MLKSRILQARRRSRRTWVFAAVAVTGLTVSLALSFAVGANPLSLVEVWRVLVLRDDSEASIIVWELRGPRTLLGVVAGAAFGVAGALMQALTRNPLADPGLLGVNAGAGFAVTIGIACFGAGTSGQTTWWALCGAAAAATFVLAIGASSRRMVEPVTLVLAGVALSAVLGGASTFLALIDEDTFRSVVHWGLGSIARGTLDTTLAVLPCIVVGLGIAVMISGTLNTLSLGDDLASALGTRIRTTQVAGVLAIALLAGSATALTGGIAFIGIMVPHVIRWWIGPDHRWLIVGSAALAPIVVLAADALGRVIGAPGEVHVGILAAVVGAPVLIAIARRSRLVEL